MQQATAPLEWAPPLRLRSPPPDLCGPEHKRFAMPPTTPDVPTEYNPRTCWLKTQALGLWADFSNRNGPEAFPPARSDLAGQTKREEPQHDLLNSRRGLDHRRPSGPPRPSPPPRSAKRTLPPPPRFAMWPAFERDGSAMGSLTYPGFDRPRPNQPTRARSTGPSAFRECGWITPPPCDDMKAAG